MSNAEFCFTPEQEAAIRYRGGALLVSAAAGSGKTKVLVERLLSRVVDGDDIDEFLVITYTRAAAMELREKIYDEIMQRLADEPENRRLRRQSMLCRGASIDTIHGFCTDVLRENAHLAELTPDFRVADQSESDMIKADILDDVLNNAYETIEESEGFRALIDMISAGRDDNQLVRIVLDTHAKIQSNPDPREWAQEQIERLSLGDVTDVSETIWGAQLMEKTFRTVRFWVKEMQKVRNTMKSLPDFDRAYSASVEATISDLEAFQAALDEDWEGARRHCNVDFKRVKPKPISGYEDLKDIRKRCRAAMKKCAEVFERSSQEHIEDMRAIAPAMTALLQLILEFDRVYSIEKRRRSVADFSDLEHLALNLLHDNKTGEKTSLARSISNRFKEIMVDEYQDVNAVQEQIFNAVSQNGKNIFMVGDVKQSIYRFRLADPTIFLEKYKTFTQANEKHHKCTAGPHDNQYNPTTNITTEKCHQSRRGRTPGRPADPSDSTNTQNDAGTKILLSKNFRSRTGILDAVNYIFSNIMSIEFGEMDYTKDEWLVPGRDNDNPNNDAVELNIIDMSALEQDDDEESPASTQIEARFIAERIAELINSGYMIPDGQKGTRRVEYSDIVILLRTIRGKAWQYSTALAEHDIPVDMPGGEGFFETIEISSALSLLSVIDNPKQDIPLAAALRGPVYGFSDDELAEIRAGSRGTDFYSALVKAAETNKKCASFLFEIDALREVMPDMPSDRFIWHVYNMTGLLGRVGAMKGGDRRRSNLILLAESARGFEQSGYKGLFGFLAYIRGLIERGADITRGATEPLSASAATNAVRIMSIHKSKGLEFPVVILADTTKKINNIDAQQRLVLHKELGVGPMRIDRQRRIEYTTLSRTAIQSKLTSEMMSEELRLLYVAMTRAREKLIITATYKDADSEIEKLSNLSSANLAPQVLEEIKNMAGWILLPLIGSEDSQITICKSKITTSDISSRVSDFEARTSDIGLRASDISSRVSDFEARTSDIGLRASDMGFRASDTVKKPALTEQKAPETFQEYVEQLSDLFSFAYPHPRAPDLPSKLTVTGLKGRQIDQESAVLDPDSGQWSADRDDSQSENGETDKPETRVLNTGSWIPNTGSRIQNTGLRDQSTRYPGGAYARPLFITKQAGLTAVERGTALHLAMQYIDYAKCAGAAGVKGEIERLASKGFLTGEQAAAVDVKKITRFIESDIGKRVLNAKNIKREFKFSLLCPAEQFYPGGGEDKILLQGVVDCFFEEDGALTVIDFKTDHVTADTIDEKANHYAPQLAAYSEALERITGKKVKERIIYFFALDEKRVT